MDFLKDTQNQFEEVIASFESQLKTIHTGRAHAGLVEDIKVNHYNTILPIKQLASISAPSSQEIVIRSWDQGALVSIEAALRESGRNYNPINDGTTIRIALPPLSGERREELKKLVARTAESARVALRSVRDETWRQVKQAEKSKAITEDDRYRLEKQLNELIANYNEKIETIIKAKIVSIEV